MIYFFVTALFFFAHHATAVTQIDPSIAQATITNAEIAGAVIMPALEKNVDPKKFAQTLCEVHVISYMLLRPDWNKKMIDTIQSEHDALCGQGSGLLIVAIDAEPSLLKSRMPTLVAQKTSTLTTEKKAYAMAQKIAKKLHDSGVTVTFAPVYDSNKNKAVIGTRSFGSDSKSIISLTRAYVRGTHDAGVYAAAKHFPGHGMALGDTHTSLQTIPGTLLELPQFKAAIADAVPFMMVGHLVVKGGEWDSKHLPASLSPIIMTKLLKNTLHYSGIVITDALNMGAVSNISTAPLDALVAGADIALFPKDVHSAYDMILKKISTDEKFKIQMLQSMRKIKGIQKNIISIKKI